MIRMTYKRFDELTEKFSLMPPVYDGKAPDFEKVKRCAKNDKEYLKFLIWYQAATEETEETRESLGKAWDEISRIAVLV